MKKTPMALHRFARKTVFLKNLQAVCRHWHPSMAVWQKSCRKQKDCAAMKKHNQAIEELERLYANLKACVYDHGIHLDFSHCQ